MPGSIDVVIPVRDRFDLTERCLRHLAAQTLSHQLSIVDDGSTDGTAERLREQWPAVHAERLASSRGFAEACNRGAARRLERRHRPAQQRRRVPPRFPRAPDRAIGRRSAGRGSGCVADAQPGEAPIDSVGLCADVTLRRVPAPDRPPRELAAGAGAAAGASRRRGCRLPAYAPGSRWADWTRRCMPTWRSST